jgi:hypothetical protein
MTSNYVRPNGQALATKRRARSPKYACGKFKQHDVPVTDLAETFVVEVLRRSVVCKYGGHEDDEGEASDDDGRPFVECHRRGSILGGVYCLHGRLAMRAQTIEVDLMEQPV